MKKLLLILTIFVIGQIKADAFLDAYIKITDANTKNLVAQYLYYMIYENQAQQANLKAQNAHMSHYGQDEAQKADEIAMNESEQAREQAVKAIQTLKPLNLQAYQTAALAHQPTVKADTLLTYYTIAYCLTADNRKITVGPDTGKLLVDPTSDFQSQKCQLYSTDSSKICPKVSA